MSIPEPAILRSGKAFHELVQRYYSYLASLEGNEVTLVKAFPEEEDSAESSVNPKLDKPRKPGRIDHFFWVDEKKDHGVILEIKNTYSDSLAEKGTVHRNLTSHIRQVKSYRGGDLVIREDGAPPRIVCLVDVERTAGIVYPAVPQTPGLREQIEEVCEENFIAVVWFNEPPVEGELAWTAWQAMQEGALPPLDRKRQAWRTESKPNRSSVLP